jgi:dihydroorotate dehydrogenase electron transfer subunit
MIHQIKARIADQHALAPGYLRMILRCQADYSQARPGQFVMLGIPGGQMLLRRPFSIHRLTDGGGGQTDIAILYKIVGQGTRALSRLAPGTRLDLLGPLGQGFRIRPDQRRIAIAAGGIGVAPMLFLAEYLAGTHDLADCEVFLGGRTRSDLLCLDDFRRLGVKVHRTTDDGSDGAQCFLTHPLEIEAGKRPPDIIYACGPMEMLGCVAGIAARLDIPCQVSIESVMACGVGACLGCAVAGRATDGYLHVCKDGPVFDAHRLRWSSANFR